MEDAELEELEQRMHELLTEFGLDWVRANIEEGVAVRGNIDVVPRGRKPEPEPLFEEGVDYYAVPKPGYKGPTMVGDVPVSPSDRVDLIIEALRRLIVELPAIQEDAVGRLAISNDHDSVAEDMTFLPGEDDSAQPVPSVHTIKDLGRARQAADEFLRRMLDEVRQS